jgi:hypothetical protein
MPLLVADGGILEYMVIAFLGYIACRAPWSYRVSLWCRVFPVGSRCMQNLIAEFESKVALNVVASERGREVIPVNGVCDRLGPLEANTVLLEELLVSKRMVDTVGEIAGDGLACHEELHFVDGKRENLANEVGE